MRVDFRQSCDGNLHGGVPTKDFQGLQTSQNGCLHDERKGHFYARMAIKKRKSALDFPRKTWGFARGLEGAPMN